jgi:hypothetical protein
MGCIWENSIHFRHFVDETFFGMVSKIILKSSQVNFHELPRNFASEVIPWLWTPNGSPTGPDPQGELTPSGLTRRSSCTLPTDTWRSSQQVGDRFMVGLMVGL